MFTVTIEASKGKFYVWVINPDKPGDRGLWAMVNTAEEAQAERALACEKYNVALDIYVNVTRRRTVYSQGDRPEVGYRVAVQLYAPGLKLVAARLFDVSGSQAARWMALQDRLAAMRWPV